MFRKALVVAAAGFCALSCMSASAKDLRFALVPKYIGNPFYDAARDGCRKAAREIGGIECVYDGPGEQGDGSEQVRMVQDMITRGVDGIAVSVSNAAAMPVALRAAQAAGIKVVTFDSDLLPKDRGLRAAYTGTKNYDIGVNLAKLAQQAKPRGGKICIQSGLVAAANLQARMQGIRDQLGGMSGTEPPGKQLTGQQGWTEVAGCPVFNDSDAAKAVQQLADVLNKYPDLDVFVSTTAVTQWADNAYRQAVTPYLAKIRKGELLILVADTVPVQIRQLADGYAHANVGQRPFEMGYQAMHLLKKLVDGKAVEDPVHTGLNICTKENAKTCLPQQ
jgi:ribose transport system substrate-binding protein